MGPSGVSECTLKPKGLHSTLVVEADWSKKSRDRGGHFITRLHLLHVVLLNSIRPWVLSFYWWGTLINNQEDSEILPASHWYSGFSTLCFFIWHWENFKWRTVFFQRAVLNMGDVRRASQCRAHARALTVWRSERRPDWSLLPSSGRLISIWDNWWVIEQIGHARPSFKSLLLMHPRRADLRIDRRLWLVGKQ